MRLVLPNQPGGQPGQVTFISPSGTEYPFRQQGASYSALPGVYGALAQDGTGYLLTLPSNDTHRFDAQGRLTAWTNAQGHQLSFNYYNVPGSPWNGFLERVADATGQRYLTFSYTGTDSMTVRLQAVTDPLARQVQYAYEDAILRSVTDLMNRTTVYTTSAGLLTQIAVEGELQLTNEYEVARVAVGGGGVVKAAYVLTNWSPIAHRRVRRQTDGRGVVTSYGYETTEINPGAGRKATKVTTQEPGKPAIVEYHIYQANGALDRIEVPTTAGSVVLDQATFDPISLGRNTSTDRYGAVTRYSSNAIGQTTAMTDALGRIIKVDYDAARRPKTVVDPLGRQTTYSYGPGNVLKQVTIAVSTPTPLQLTTVYTYDVAYPGKHWLESSSDALGRTTRYTYTAWGQPSSIIDPLGQVTSYTYDAVGRMLSATDVEGRVTRYRYNADDTLAEMTLNCTTSAGVPTTGTCAAFAPAYPDRNVGTAYGYDRQKRQIWVRDQLGRYTATHYTAAGLVDWTAKNLVAPELPARLPAKPPAYQPATPDKNISISYAYNALGHMTFMTETGFLTGSLTVDAAVSATSVRFPSTYQRVTRIESDLFGRPLTVTLNYGGATSPQRLYRYEDQPHRDWVRDELGRWTVTEYDAAGHVSKVTERYQDGIPGPGDADFRTVQEYTPQGQLKKIIRNYEDGIFDHSNPLTDVVTLQEYDGWGRLNRTTQNQDLTPLPNATDVNLVSQLYHDVIGNVYASVDPLGRITRTERDALDRVVRTITNCTGPQALTWPGGCDAHSNARPDRNIATITSYTSLGRTAAVTETVSASQVRVSVSAYDGLGRLVKTVQNCMRNGLPAVQQCDAYSPGVSDRNIVTSHVYDAVGRRRSSMNTLGFTVQYGYNDLDLQVSRVTEVGDLLVMGYDGRGVQRWQRTNLGIVTLYQTDPLDRIGRTIENYKNGLPDASEPTDYDVITTRTFDAGGRVLTTADREGFQTRITYTLQNQPEVVIENDGGTRAPSNVTTRASYDRLGQLPSLTDPRGHTRRWTYDTAGRRTSAIDGKGRTTSWQYDRGGRQVRQTSPRGSAYDLTYSYDDRDALRFTTATGLSIESQYDALGRRNVLIDSTGTTRFNYDLADRMISAVQPVVGTLGYGYNGVGNRTSITYPNGGPVVTTVYDQANYPWTMAENGQPIYEAQISSVNRIMSIGLGNGLRHFWDRDDLGRLWRTKVTDGLQASDEKFSIRYDLDRHGTHLYATQQFDRSIPASPGPGGSHKVFLPMLYAGPSSDGPIQWRYERDGLKRLTGVIQVESAEPRESYTYDNSGNITSANGGDPWTNDPADQVEAEGYT